MQHSSALEFNEQEAPCHVPVLHGGGKEAQTAGRGGSAGEFGEGLPGLRINFGDRDIIQISGKGADGGGKRLTSSSRQPEER